MTKVIDSVGLVNFGQQFLGKLDLRYDDKYVAQEDFSNDFTNEEKSKLAGVEAGAEVNDIETVKINESVMTVTDKAVSIPVTEGDTDGTIKIGGQNIAVKNFTSSMNAKANVASPTFTGTPTTTNPAVGDSSTQIPTTSWVNTAITNALADSGSASDQVVQAIAARVSALETSAAAVVGAYVYQGTVATYAALPSSGNEVGYVYNVEAAYGEYPAGTNYAWTGSAWDALGGAFSVETMSTADVTAAIDQIFPSSQPTTA